jgi:hypothetical protein
MYFFKTITELNILLIVSVRRLSECSSLCSFPFFKTFRNVCLSGFLAGRMLQSFSVNPLLAGVVEPLVFR